MNRLDPSVLRKLVDRPIDTTAPADYQRLRGCWKQCLQDLVDNDGDDHATTALSLGISVDALDNFVDAGAHSLLLTGVNVETIGATIRMALAVGARAARTPVPEDLAA